MGTKPVLRRKSGRVFCRRERRDWRVGGVDFRRKEVYGFGRKGVACKAKEIKVYCVWRRLVLFPLFRGETNRPDRMKRQHLYSLFMAKGTP